MIRISNIPVTFLFALGMLSPAMAQKKVSELKLVYEYSILTSDPGSKPEGPTPTASFTVYIKNQRSRSEMKSPLFSSTTISDAKDGSAVILKEVSGQKLLIKVSAENWEEKNKRFQGMHFVNTSENKVIAGYHCIKAVAMTNDSFNIVVYYTKELIPDNKDYDPPFKNLDGLPLEYEYELAKGKIKIFYTLSAIDLNPVPASKFDIPKTGYREMSYEESKKLNTGG